MARPLGEVVIDSDRSGSIENVAGGPERLRHLWRPAKIKERREGEPHPTPLIGDGRSAGTTTHLAGKRSGMDILFAVIEFQAIGPTDYPDIVLVEDRGPLHRGPMQSLACQTMANFGIDGVRTDFKSNRLAETPGHVFDDEAGILGRCILRSEFFFHLASAICASHQITGGVSQRGCNAHALRFRELSGKIKKSKPIRKIFAAL